MFVKFLLFLFCTVLSLKQYTFVVDREYLSPDCVEKLQITINGIFPGPEIRVLPNEEIIIDVENKLVSESITIHWHGQDQLGTPFMDGIGGISQCPIPPHTSFRYRFHVNDLPGTYFYHIHVGALLTSGGFGPFIIENENNNLDYNNEFTMLLFDHYHRNVYHSQYNLLRKSFRWVFDPNSILINGKGVFNCTNNDVYSCNDDNNCMDGGGLVCGANERPYTRFNAYGTLCNNNNCNYQIFNVNSNSKYLFRLINSSPLSHLNVKFDKHGVTIVAVDGFDTKPLLVDSIDLHSGQRVDILLETGSDIDNYWIVAKIRSRSGIRYGLAVLNYNGMDENILPSNDFKNIGQPIWNDYTFTRNQQNAMQGLTSPPDNSKVERRIIFVSSQERFDLANNMAFNGVKDIDIEDLNSILNRSTGYNTVIENWSSQHCDSNNDENNLRWAHNRNTFQFDSTPSILSYKFGYDKSFWSSLSEQELEKYGYIKLEKDKIYDIIFQNFPACNGLCETHSLHIHGHHGWLLGHFKGEWQGTQAQIDKLCTNDCPFRDTVFLIADSDRPGFKGCGYTVLRIKATSPGIWPIHCHQTWHFLMGKISVFYYDRSDIPLPKSFNDILTCGNVNPFDIVAGYGNTGLKYVKRLLRKKEDKSETKLDSNSFSKSDSSSS